MEPAAGAGVILPPQRDPRFTTLRRGGTLTDPDHRLLALWAASCAEHVLPLFEADQPADPRPRHAVDEVRAWARGEVRMSDSRAAGGHAMAAARPLAGAARHAAFAAGQAAVVAHVAAHELGAAAYAIKAVRAAAPDGQGEAAGGSSAGGSARSCPTRSASSCSTTSGCATTSAGRCSTADRAREAPASPGARRRRRHGIRYDWRMTSLRFGIKLSQNATIDQLRDLWRLADESGFDSCWVMDHFATLGPRDDGPIFETWTMLAAMAQLTTRTRIGCAVVGNTYRHPAVLAKMAVTVDHLSGGRLDFGIGAGWAENEHTMLGLEFGTRGDRADRLEESLQVIRGLWTQPRTTFAGTHYQLQDAVAEPKPVQRPHPPIWIGGSGPKRTLRLRRAVRRRVERGRWHARGGRRLVTDPRPALCRRRARPGRDPPVGAARRRRRRRRPGAATDRALRGGRRHRLPAHRAGRTTRWPSASSSPPGCPACASSADPSASWVTRDVAHATGVHRAASVPGRP